MSDPEVMDSKKILEKLYDRLLGRGMLIRQFESSSINVGYEDDGARIDDASLFGKVSLIRVGTKAVSIAYGWAYFFPHLSPFYIGVLAHSLRFPLEEKIIVSLNQIRSSDNPLGKDCIIEDLTTSDIEDLFNYDLQWYGAGTSHTGELLKLKGGLGADTEAEDIPSELVISAQTEKEYSSKHERTVNFYIGDNKTTGKQSLYKHPDALNHLESWLVEKLQLLE